LRKGGQTFLVQCKQWKAFKVGVDVVRQLYGVMAARGATGGFVVTSGRFTDEAGSFADGRNLTLVDGPRLAAMLASARSAKERSGGRAVPIDRVTSATATPACPSCGSPMTPRTAKRGPNAGSAFWGCSTYPACKGTRAVEPDEPKLEQVPSV
jgi:restriction system protein